VKDNNKRESRAYLHVIPRHAQNQRRYVFEIRDESPRITLTHSVTSRVEAHKLATVINDAGSAISQTRRHCATSGLGCDATSRVIAPLRQFLPRSRAAASVRLAESD
jgi:hypothetical protein